MIAMVERRGGTAGMSMITLVMVAVLLGLGVWQLRRKDEKHILIAALTERLAAAPVALPPKAQWATLTPQHDEFRRVFFSIANGASKTGDKPDARVFTSGSALRPDVSGLGTWDFAPFQIAPDEAMVVNLGFIADGSQVSSSGPASEVARASVLTGYIRFPEKPGWFSAHENVDKRLWFVRDHQAMARALNWGDVAPFYIDLETPVPRSGSPKPGALEVHLPDQHLQYAITWFGLAGVVAVAFLFWIFGQRRHVPGG